MSKESTCQKVWDFLMKIMKSTTDLDIIKFFSLQTVYRYCERLYITKKG